MAGRSSFASTVVVILVITITFVNLIILYHKHNEYLIQQPIKKPQPIEIPIADTLDLEKKMFQDREELYEERRKLVKKYCEIYKSLEDERRRFIGFPVYFPPYKFIYSSKFKLLYKEVPKCGSRTWRENFRILEHRGGLNQTYMKGYSSGAELNQDMKDRGFLTFMFTRHPFERVLSAYKDKIEPRLKGTPDFYHISHKIARRYGNGNWYCTFAEFVRSIGDNFQYDRHWSPVANIAYPCDISYTVIGKVETYEEDSNYIIRKLNLTALDPKAKKHATPQVDKIQFWSTITNIELFRLYKKFQSDFELYGYDWKEYLKYVKSDGNVTIM